MVMRLLVASGCQTRYPPGARRCALSRPLSRGLDRGYGGYTPEHTPRGRYGMTTSSMSTSTAPGQTDRRHRATVTRDRPPTRPSTRRASPATRPSRSPADVRTRPAACSTRPGTRCRTSPAPSATGSSRRCAPSATTSTAWPRSATASRPVRRARWRSGRALQRAARRPGAERAARRPAVLRPSPPGHVPGRRRHLRRRRGPAPARRPRRGPGTHLERQTHDVAATQERPP